jgi:hypothetical protein
VEAGGWRKKKKRNSEKNIPLDPPKPDFGKSAASKGEGMRDGVTG